MQPTFPTTNGENIWGFLCDVKCSDVTKMEFLLPGSAKQKPIFLFKQQEMPTNKIGILI